MGARSRCLVKLINSGGAFDRGSFANGPEFRVCALVRKYISF